MNVRDYWGRIVKRNPAWENEEAVIKIKVKSVRKLVEQAHEFGCRYQDGLNNFKPRSGAGPMSNPMDIFGDVFGTK